MTYTSKELEQLKVDPWVINARRWRRKHNLRQAEFCAMVDINKSHWGLIELGKRKPSRELMERVDVVILRWKGK